MQSETVLEKAERKVLSRWPNNLLRKVKRLKKENKMDVLPDLRSTLLLSGIAERVPESAMSLETIDAEQTPYLGRHVMKHSFNQDRSLLHLNTVEVSSSRAPISITGECDFTSIN